MKEIALGNGGCVIVDDRDYEWLIKHTWTRKADGYALRQYKIKGRNFQVLMHREIMQTAPGMECDHINHNPLDNRRSNLRNCSSAENGWNSRRHKNSSFIYKGIGYGCTKKTWRMRLCKNYHKMEISGFQNERHAALAYDLWAVDLFGEYAHTNFKVIGYTKRKPGLNE